MPRSRLLVHTEPAPDLAARTRERCPRIVFTMDGTEIARLRSDVETPELPVDTGSVTTINIRDDALSIVIDEQAWLAELARMLRPGGTLTFPLPASGPLAWLDAQNVHRYMVDILHRGDAPDGTLPTGWHRHYSRDEVNRLLRDADFSHIGAHQAGIGLTEIVQLAGLIAGNFVLQRRGTERSIFPVRVGMARAERTLPAPGLGTLWDIRATRAVDAPRDPDPGATPPNRPAPEIDSE